jgi:putative membrane protein
MLRYLFLSGVGCGLGVITGLTPGLHVNTVCLLGLSLYLRFGLDAVDFGITMVAMSLTHTFLDFIPAIFLGVPEEDTALSVLPTHQLLLAGRALEAVKLTAYGSLVGFVFALIMLVPAIYTIPVIYHHIRGYVVYLIGLAAVLLILREGGWVRRLWALCIFFLSGALGLQALNLGFISATHVLFPVFAGLFGLSGILY